MNSASDVLVIGAGVIGAATAYFATQQGLTVTVLDKGLPASGTSSACEGNILVSDKELGPELELTRYSLGVWHGDLAEHKRLWEFESKGGIIVAFRESSLASLNRVMAAQAGYGVVWTSWTRITCGKPNRTSLLTPWAGRATPKTARSSQCWSPHIWFGWQPKAGPFRCRHARQWLPPERRPHHRCPDTTRRLLRRRRGELHRYVGRRTRRPGRGQRPGPPPPRLRHGHRATAAHGPPQGLCSRIHRQRRQLRRRAPGLPGSRGHSQRHHPHRLNARTRRFRPHREHRCPAASGGQRRRTVPLPGARQGHPPLPRLPPVLPGPPSGDRPRRARPRAVACRRP